MANRKEWRQPALTNGFGTRSPFNRSDPPICPEDVARIYARPLAGSGNGMGALANAATPIARRRKDWSAGSYPSIKVA